MEEVKQDESSSQRLSCLPTLDALWFCYSPVYQVKQYYREGEFDSCRGKWTEFMGCLSLKTRPALEVHAVLKEREKEKVHIWQFRSKEEAAEFWKKEFGHLEEN